MRLGIDLGTCLSCAGLLADGEIKLVKEPIRHGYSFPSSVYVTDKGEVLVGCAADNNRRKDPSRYKREFKRDWGSGEAYRLGDRQMLPEELAAEVLRKLRAEALKMAGHRASTVDAALVTVPANYQSHKRKLVKQAGRAAGFDEVEVLEEPVAAAIYYTWSGGVVEEGEVLLVYDLGGGTFDAALIRRRGPTYELVAPPVGLEHCGGVDFDRKIYADVVARCGPALAELLDPARRDLEALRARAVVADFCRDVKHHLSEALDASDEILLPRVDPETYELTRDRFNAMIRPLLEETCELCRTHVRASGLTLEEVKGVLLVGGSCRTPYVQEVVAKQLGRPVFWVEDPELAVCKGAAIYGASIDGVSAGQRPAKAPGSAADPSVPLVVSASGDADHATIGAALAAAAPGGRVLVRPGVYREALTIEREVEISGDGAAGDVVVESANASAVVMAADRATLRNLTLRVASDATAQVPVVDVPRGELVVEQSIVEGGTLACVAVHGESARPTLRDTTIRGAAQSGVFVYERASALVERCRIERNGYSGVDVGQGATPVVRETTITANKQCGVCVFDGGRGTFEACEISGNAISGVMARQGGDPTVRGCRISGEQVGVLVSVEGKGTIEECEIVACEVAGVDVKKGGDPVVRRSTILGSKRNGVTIRDGGRGTVEECRVSGSAGADVSVAPGCTPVLRANVIGDQTPQPQPAAIAPAQVPALAPDLLVPEQFFLLCYDPVSGGFLCSETHVRYGLHAALLADLFLRGRLTLTPQRAVVVANPYPVGVDVMDFVLQRVAGTAGAFELGRWLRFLDDRWGHPLTSFGVVHDMLVRRGVLSARPASEPLGARQRLVARLREGVLGGQPLDEPLAVVFSLLRACGASAGVVAPAEIVSRRGAIDALDARNPLGVALASRIVELIAEDAHAAGRG